MEPFLQALSTWSSTDWWTVATAAVAAMSCAVPGVYLVLRRQSMMGDAISHTVLAGIVVAFLAADWLSQHGWISSDRESYIAWQRSAMFVGAVVIGIVSALLTQGVQNLGKVESSAALGVVFTTLFAFGLLLIRLEADNVHIDPDCVLYGTIETVVIDTVPGTSIPTAFNQNGLMLLINLALVGIFYKELKISTFDPALATTLGYDARWMHYGLMAVTAASLVAAFESVGSILVIAMLIVPAATASLLTHRLGIMILLSLGLAGVSALVGHVLAIGLPPMIFTPLGYPEVAAASTAGMMAAAAGLFFVAAVILAPGQGLLSRTFDHVRLGIKIASEDLLGILYRMEEHHLEGSPEAAAETIDRIRGLGPLYTRLASFRLKQTGQVMIDATGYHLTDAGRAAAQQLVRSHRLWEAYLAKHFEASDARMHVSAERTEHYIGPQIRDELAAELDSPEHDPHGRSIPEEHPDSSAGT